MPSSGILTKANSGMHLPTLPKKYQMRNATESQLVTDPLQKRSLQLEAPYTNDHSEGSHSPYKVKKLTVSKSTSLMNEKVSAQFDRLQQI